MNNALLYIGGLLVVALAALSAVPYFVDWNSYRGMFEEEASRILGREVRVGGSVNLRFLPAPFVRFEKLRIADISGEGGTSLIRAESFTMWLSVPPLLKGVLEAHKVELKRPVIQLAIDASGAGNWRTLTINPGLLPFVPSDVALQSVRLTDGVVGLKGPNRVELAHLEAINGELMAEALEGPYRFKGTLQWNGEERGVRFATARQEANGDVRFKAAVEAAGTGNSYVFDGRASDLKGQPRLEGELAAKLALSLKLGAPSPEGDSAAVKPPVVLPQDFEERPAEVPPGPATDVARFGAPNLSALLPRRDGPEFDFRAKVKGSGSGIELSEIAVTLEHGGPPQLMTGSARMAWEERMRLEVALSSRWLDLDRIVDANSGAVPLEAARSMFEALAAMLPSEADTNATLEFDQVSLGGEALSGVRIAAARTNGPLELKELRAGLPGGSSLEIKGQLVTAAKARRFEGALALRGHSLLRFLGWGFRQQGTGDGRTDGTFALEGHLALAESVIELTDARAEFAGFPLAGEVKLGLGARKRLAVALEGPRLDAAQIRSGILGLGTVQAFLDGVEPDHAQDENKAGAAAKQRFLDPATADLALKLRVAELFDGGRTLRDVEAEFTMERGALSMPVLKFATPEGLVVEAEGEATEVLTRPLGAIRGRIAAPSPDAVAALIRLLDLADDERLAAERFTALAPVRLAGTLNFSGRTERAADLTLDGVVQGGRATVALRLDGGRDNWRAEPLDITASVESQDVDRLLAATLSSTVKPADTKAARPGRLVVKAAGTPAAGVLALATIEADGFSIEYRGRLALPSPGAADAAGNLRISAGDARTLLGFAGVRVGGGAAGVPLDGSAALAIKDGVLSLNAEDLAIGASKVRGLMTLAKRVGEPRVLTADLQVDTGTFTGLMAPILSRGEATTQEPAPAVPEKPVQPGQAGQPRADKAPAAVEAHSVWPEQAFDLGALDEIEGRITARFGALALEPGLTVSDARLEATFGKGGIKVEALEGGALGGKLLSSLALDKGAAGIELKGSLRIDIGSAEPAPAQAGAAGDAAAFSLAFAGRALSPAALLADVKGQGEIVLGDATLNGMSPAAVTQVVEQALAGKGPASGDGLVQALRAATKEGQLKLGRITIPVEIGDGALKLGQVKLESSEGRSTFTTTVELASMKIDSEWRIEPKVARHGAAAGDRVLLPAVSVVYVGKLKDFASLEPSISTGALERELQVRKMERDVDELERLRKLDQSRGRQEAEPAKSGAAPPDGGASQTPPAEPVAPAPEPGASSTPQGADVTAGVPPESAAETAQSPAGDPSGLTQTDAPGARPAIRKKKPAEVSRPPDNWRPFQTTP